MNRKQLAVVHIAKKKLGLDDDTYRELLKSVAGVESARDLSYAGFEKVMRRFAECGWKAAGGDRLEARGERLEAKTEKPASAKPTSAQSDAVPGDDRKRWAQSKWRQFAKLEVLLREQGLSWEYADGIARRMFGVKVVRWCTGEQLRAVTAALVYRGKKRNAKLDG